MDSQDYPDKPITILSLSQLQAHIKDQIAVNKQAGSALGIRQEKIKEQIENDIKTLIRKHGPGLGLTQQQIEEEITKQINGATKGGKRRSKRAHSKRRVHRKAHRKSHRRH